MKAMIKTAEHLYRFAETVAAKLDGKTYEIECKPKKSTRSLQQNAYLWGVCYKTILEAGELDLEGWRAEDLHEYFLGQHFGWETLEGFGRKRLRPLNRSSTLSKMEFVDFVAYIQQTMAEIGIVIPDPDADAASDS